MQCLHQFSKIVYKVDKIGRKSYVIQCEACGALLSKSIKKGSLNLDLDSVPRFDKTLEKKWYEAHRPKDFSTPSSHLREFRERMEGYYASPAWKELRRKVLERSGGKCEECKRVKAVHVHHKTYVRFRNERLTDLQALCLRCHQSKHKHKIGK